VIWETEVSDDKVNKNLDTTIDSGLRTAQMVHDNLVLGGVSAFHYWWLMPSGTSGGNGALTANNTLLPRAWALGNWSKFVRPGFVRVAADPLSQEYVYSSAFLDAAGGRFVLVVINQAYFDVDQDFAITGGTVATLTPWLTATGQNLVAQATVPVTDGGVSVTLPMRSVTTFVGTVSP